MTMRVFVDNRQYLTALRCLFAQARSFSIAMALVRRSGLDQILGAMTSALKSSATGRVLFGIDMPTEPAAITALLDLRRQFHGQFEVRRYEWRAHGIFHPKLYAFELTNGEVFTIIGSSNLTAGGLSENIEANVAVDDRTAGQQAIKDFDKVFNGVLAKPVDDDWVADYRPVWATRQRDWDRLERSRRKLDRLSEKVRVAAGLPMRIEGHRFAFTGKLNRGTRQQLIEEVARYGGTVLDNPASIPGVDCLIRGTLSSAQKSTHKLRNAKRSGIRVVDETRFLEIVAAEKTKRAIAKTRRS